MDGLTKAIYGSTHNGEHVRVSVYAICMAQKHGNSPFVGLSWGMGGGFQEKPDIDIIDVKILQFL